jgi:acetyltransferase-like isoleucine patch superfamily enzyme
LTETRLKPDTPFVHQDCEIKDATFGKYVEIGRGSRVAHSHLDDYSYCDRFADIANASVGKFSNIASFVRIGATDHPMEKASLHHFRYRSADYFEDADDDDAWFAHRRTRRAVIGHGAVIAGGAIVTKDVPPYMIIAGIPAVPMRTRFAPDIADRLMAMAWWDWPHDRLRAALNDFRSLGAEAFLERYG